MQHLKFSNAGIVSKLIYRSSCLAQLEEHSILKKARHMKGRYPSLSPNRDSLIQCN